MERVGKQTPDNPRPTDLDSYLEPRTDKCAIANGFSNAANTTLT